MAADNEVQILTTANPAQLIRTAFRKEFEPHLREDILISDLVQSVTHPKNTGKTVAFHRVMDLPKEKAALGGETAGSYIDGKVGQLRLTGIVVDEVTATIGLYGNDVHMSELLFGTTEPSLMQEISSIMAYNSAATRDALVGDILAGSGATLPTANYDDTNPLSVTAVYGDGSDATLLEATLDADQNHHRAAVEALNRIRTLLKKEHVPYHPKLPGSYCGLITPTIAGDLRADATFQELVLKGPRFGEERFQMASMGRIFGIELFETDNIPTTAGTIDGTNDQISRMPVFGAGYAKTLDWGGGMGKVKSNFLPPKIDRADPYGVIASWIWKMYFAGAVCNPLAGVVWKAVTTTKISTHPA